MLLLSLVRRILGVFHLVIELEERIFYVVEARRRGLAVARGADGRHTGGLASNKKNYGLIKQDARTQVLVLCL